MHSFIILCLCLVLYLVIVQTKNTDNADDTPRTGKCRQCRKLSTREDKRLCRVQFCKKGKIEAKAPRMKKKCNSCPAKLTAKNIQPSDDDGPNSRRCKPCRKFFKGDDGDLCVDMFCKDRHTRPNIKTQKRCNSCPKRFKGQKLQSCQQLFCNEQVQADPDFVARTGFALTVDILCAYCKTTSNQQCLSLYKCSP